MNVQHYSTAEKHKDPPPRLMIHIAPATSIIQRKFCKIQRKTVEFTSLNFLTLKSLSAAVFFLCLYSWAPDASFDTHIVIYNNVICQKPCVIICHNMSKLSNMTYYDTWGYDISKKFAYHYGFQKKRQDLCIAETKLKIMLTMILVIKIWI